MKATALIYLADLSRRETERWKFKFHDSITTDLIRKVTGREKKGRFRWYTSFKSTENGFHLIWDCSDSIKIKCDLDWQSEGGLTAVRYNDIYTDVQQGLRRSYFLILKLEEDT